MRRFGFVFVLMLVLAAPFVVRGLWAQARAERTRHTPGPELRILTPHNQDIREAFAHAFADWHEQRFGHAVRIVYLTPGGTLDIVRYLTDAYSTLRTPDGRGLVPESRVSSVAELVWGGGDVTFERELKPFLKPVALPRDVLDGAFPTPDLNGIPLYERTSGPSPRWVGIALSSFGILYSPDLYRRLGLSPPSTWNDLTRPELAGLVALADPTRSGSAAVAYVMPVQRAMADAEAEFLSRTPDASLEELATSAGYRAALARGWQRGMQTLLLIAANARYFTDSASQSPNDVGNGEAAAGLAIDFYARVFQETIGEDRLRYVAPRAATAITPDPIGVLYGTVGHREELANRFIEFLLSREAQRLWNLKGGKSPYLPRSLRRLPIRRDVYADRAGWADDVDPFRDAGEFNLRPEWMRSFSELRLVWGAAWIDGKSALDAAHRRILKVRDAERRAVLLQELARLPIELSELEQLTTTRKELERAGARGADARLFLARARVDLGTRFRRHYAAIAAKAAVE